MSGKSNIRATKEILLTIKDNLKDIEYWTNENDLGVVESVQEEIKVNFRVLLRCLKHLSSNLN